MNTIATLRRVGVAVAGLSVAASTLAIAAPAEAAPGVFRYEGYPSLAQRTGKEEPPKATTIMSPEAGKCIKTPNAGNAENYTAGDIVLYRDEACKEVAITIKPFDMDASPFNSIKAKS